MAIETIDNDLFLAIRCGIELRIAPQPTEIEFILLKLQLIGNIIYDKRKISVQVEFCCAVKKKR